MKPDIYIHKQEKWTAKKCEQLANAAPRDAFGNRPPKGIISSSSSAYVQYGKTMRYNGGIIRDGNWYRGEFKPLPKIPKTYEFYNLTSWGIIIRKK